MTLITVCSNACFLPQSAGQTSSSQTWGEFHVRNVEARFHQDISALLHDGGGGHVCAGGGQDDGHGGVETVATVRCEPGDCGVETHQQYGGYRAKK